MKGQKRMTRLAYVAGVMDGDGSFSLLKRNSSPYPYYYPAMQLSHTNKEFVYYFKDEFGGSVSHRKSYIGKDGGKRKESWRWVLEKKQSEGFLKEILPYLQLKKERATRLLGYLSENSLYKRGDVSKKNLARKERTYLKMKKMNAESGISKSSIGKIKKNPSDNPLVWAYIGGLFDTDGSFSIKREVKNIHNSYKYNPIISLGMKNLEAIAFVGKYCSVGNIKLIKAKTCKSGFSYRFSIHSFDEVASFLEKCIPYLHLKKKSAEILLKFCKNIKRTKYCRAGVSEKESSFREQCYQDLVKANNGVYKSSLIDLEVLQQDDKAEGESHRKRLNERAS